MGDICFTCSNDPDIEWAKQNAKTALIRKRWKCLGIIVCTAPSCRYRIRPKNPRWGDGTYASKGKIPEVKDKDKCPQHPGAGHDRMKCNATWWFVENPDGGITVHHKGTHNHPAPFAREASAQGKKVVRDIITNDPKSTPFNLMRGNDIRPPIADADIKFNSPDYLNHVMKGCVFRRKGREGREIMEVQMSLARQIFFWITRWKVCE
jgi:hypothetical protein